MKCPWCGYRPGRGDPLWCTWCDAPLEAGPPWWETLGVWSTMLGASLLLAAVIRWLLP